MIDLTNRLEALRKSGRGWTARCPAHDDGHASLSVRRTDDRWLLYCHAGCSFNDVIRALRVAAADLFDGDKRRRR